MFGDAAIMILSYTRSLDKNSVVVSKGSDLEGSLFLLGPPPASNS